MHFKLTISQTESASNTKDEPGQQLSKTEKQTSLNEQTAGTQKNALPNSQV